MSSPQFDTANAVKKALEHDDDQYRTIAEQSQNGIFLIDKDHISYANKALIELLGSGTDEKLEGDDLYSMLSEEDAKIIKKDVQQALEGLLSEMEYEVTAVRLDGRKIVIHLLLLTLTFEGKLHVLGVITDLTRMKDIELSLHESKIRYRTLIEHALDGIYIITPAGFEYVNPAFETITGYSQEEVCNASFNFYDIIHPDDRQLISEREQARKHGDPLPPAYQFRILTKKGTTRYIEVNTVPLAEKEPRVLGMMRDVTERREIVEKAMIGERKYRTLFESANDAIFLMMEDVFIDCNPKTLDMFGLQKEDIIGHHPYEFSPLKQPNGKDSKEEALRLIKAVLQDQPQHFYWQHHRHDMTPFDVEVSLKKIELEGHVFIQVIVHDITNQKRADELLRIAEENYRGIFENAVMGIYKSTPEGYHISTNPALAHIYGYASPADLMANMWNIAEQLYVDPQRREELLRHLLDNDTVSNFESQVYRKDGTIIWISENARTVRDSQGAVEYFVGTVENISERKAVEQQLVRFSTAVETTSDGIAVTDTEGFLIDVNNALITLLGGSDSKDLIGKPSLDFVVEEHHKQVKSDMSVVLKKGQLASTEFTLKAIDGTTIPVEMSSSVMLDKDHQPSGFVHILRDISTRKQAQKELESSEEMYRTMFEGTGTAMAIINADTTLAKVNSQFEHISGYTKEEVAGWKSWIPFVHEDDSDFMQQYHQRRRENSDDVPKRYIFKAYDKEGSIRHMLANIEMLPNSQQSIVSLIDVTDLKVMESALHKSEKQFRESIENANDAIYIITPEGFDYINSSFEELVGYSEEEIFSDEFEFMDLIHPQDRQFIQEREKARTLGKELPSRYEFRLLDKNNSIKHLEANTVDIGEGEQTRVMGILRDITERIKMEAALKESEEQFRLLAESSTSAIFIYQNNRFLYVNPSTELITGFSRQELADGKIAQELVHADDQEMVWDRETRRQQGEQVDPARYEFRIIAKNGEVKWIDFAATRIAFGGSQAALGNAYDITERKKAEEEMERALEHERDFKLRAAHHFFNPIAIAKGYLDLTLEELTDLQEQKVKAARRAICRVEKVVKNVTQRGEIYE